MRCAWQAFINLLPVWMREQVDKQGREGLQELRLRLGAQPELVFGNGSVYLPQTVNSEDLRFCVNLASRYSPWAASTVAHGFITATGGHRIGLCGTAVTENGILTGIRDITSLCIRIARDFPGIAREALCYSGSVLIIGKPGSGKTTLMRDLIRQRSDAGTGCIAVVDEREEIFPCASSDSVFSIGKHTDVLSGCRKANGVEIVLRSMGPETIAVDEITAEEDCRALLHAGWCGVNLLATAHAGSRKDLYNRPVYRPIIESKLFDTLLVMHPDKSWHAERI